MASFSPSLLQLWCWSQLITLTSQERKVITSSKLLIFFCTCFFFFFFPQNLFPFPLSHFLFMSRFCPSRHLYGGILLLTTLWDIDLVNSCLAASFETCHCLYLCMYLFFFPLPSVALLLWFIIYLFFLFTRRQLFQQEQRSQKYQFIRSKTNNVRSASVNLWTTTTTDAMPLLIQTVVQIMIHLFLPLV